MTSELSRRQMLGATAGAAVALNSVIGADPAAAACTPKIVVNVTADPYCADATGTSDASGAIQAAIDAVAGLSFSGGGAVYLPAGTYRLHASLQLKSNVWLYGDGLGTILRPDSSGVWAVRFNSGYRSRVSSLAIDASVVQTSGGGIDFGSSIGQCRVDRVTFGSNLYTLVDLRPSSGSSEFQFDTLRAFSLTQGATVGVSQVVNGFLIGDGAHQVNEIYMRNISMTAVGGQATAWLTAKFIDTLHITDALFQNGSDGVRFVQGSGANQSTGTKLTHVVVDSPTNSGLTLLYVRDFAATSCAVQTCCQGSGAPAVDIGDASGGVLVRGVRWFGGVVQHNYGTGVRVRDNARHVAVQGTHVANNNLSNAPAGQGIEIGSGTTDALVMGNQIVNGSAGYDPLGGHQKYGVLIGTGCDRFIAANNLFAGNETGKLSNGSPGAAQSYVANNIG